MNCFSTPAGEKDFSKEPLVVHIAAGGGKAVRCALVGLEEKVVHVEDGTVINPAELFAQSGLA